MNWQKATPQQIEAKVASCIQRGLGITVSPAWLQAILGERRLLARLAKCQDEPQFFNPMEAVHAINVRDRVLKELEGGEG